MTERIQQIFSSILLFFQLDGGSFQLCSELNKLVIDIGAGRLISGDLRIIELALIDVLIIEELLNASESIIFNFLDKIFELVAIVDGKLSWMSVDVVDEEGSCLSKKGMQLLKMFMHFRNGVDHVMIIKK